jgi:hypothetical protein
MNKTELKRLIKEGKDYIQFLSDNGATQDQLEPYCEEVENLECQLEEYENH